MDNGDESQTGLGRATSADGSGTPRGVTITTPNPVSRREPAVDPSFSAVGRGHHHNAALTSRQSHNSARTMQGADSGSYEKDISGTRGGRSIDNSAYSRGSVRGWQRHTAGQGGAIAGILSGKKGDPTASIMATPQQRRYVPHVDEAKIVRRPILEKRNTRQFQLSQLQRRFGFKVDIRSDAMEFPINLTPSDPEFPYDINVLNLVLTVPLAYGTDAADGKADASIRVLNADIPVGYRVNIENGFQDIVSKATATTTLLDMLNSLDKRLESFLAAKKASTIKIIPNAPSKTDATVDPTSFTDLGSAKPDRAVELPVAPHNKASTPLPSYTPDQLTAASVKCEQDIRQLEARLGRSDTFRKSEFSDGAVVFTVPFEPRRKDLLPIPLQTLKSVMLRVPKLYNLEPCTVEFTGVPSDVGDTLQRKFAKQVGGNPRWSLMAHLNALSAGLHVMATETMDEDAEEEKLKKDQPGDELLIQDIETKAIIDDNDVGRLAAQNSKAPADLDDKQHIVVIPRPPEWSYVTDGEDGYSDTGEDSEYDTSSDIGFGAQKGSEEIDAGAVAEFETNREHGTALSFPGISMTGIQLLEVLVINVTIKCNKCKTTADVMQVRPGGKPRYEACVKCNNVYGVAFRMESIHQFSNRAGFFDLVGCKIADILPSNFLPHCESCDAPLPPPGISGLVPGQTVTTNCRQCHLKMSIFIPEMKLLRISQEDDLAPHQVPKKKSEKNRFVAGTELPDRGRCAHYRKSTRWFRFACCLKVFPCDKCHDEQANPPHPVEFGNRMICGRCSREQHYRPNDCAYCGHMFVGKRSGFWEGGKGTRNKVLMSRKDPRKYKRLGKTGAKTVVGGKEKD